MPRVTSWTLIRSAADGDSEARDRFAELYLPVVQAYLRARWRGRLRDTEIDDAVQEVFISCFREGGVLDRVGKSGEQSFRSYLFGAARNVALGLERSRLARVDRNVGETFDEETHAVDEASLEALFDAQWLKNVVLRARKLQADRSRSLGEAAQRRIELLRLRFGLGLKIREIATRWEMNPKRLHKDYAQACADLRECIRLVIGFDNPDRPEVVAAEFESIASMIE